MSLAEHMAMRIRTKSPISHVQACDQVLANMLSAKVVCVISRKHVEREGTVLSFALFLEYGLDGIQS